MSSDDRMDPTTGRATKLNLRARLLGALGLVVALGAALPGAAGAVNRFTLDSNPAGPAEIAIDAAGTGYFGWVHSGGSGPNVAMFCKVPRGGTCASPVTLPGGVGNVGNTDGAFPVLGSGSTVYVVGQRFIQQDVVVWTSTDGGVTFGAPVVDPSGVSAGSDPTSVLANPAGGFYISSHNPGLTFTSVPASAGAAPVTDLTPSGGLTNLSGSALGLTSATGTGNPVEAFSLLNTNPQTVNFTSYNAGTWSTPSQVSQGTLPSLAGGPSGLFLASQDVDSSGIYNQVNVRKYTAGSGFGAPVATLQTDTASDNSGHIFQTAGGRLLVAWQGKPRLDGGVAVRLYDAGSAGSTAFTRVGDVAEGTPFVAISDFRVAAADDGQGFVSFNEIAGAGLRVADLTPIKYATSTVTALTTAGQAAATNLTVGPGTPVTDTATIQTAGITETGATGTVAYSVYSDAACKTLVTTAGTGTVGGGTAGASSPISLPTGTWYYVAQYSGGAGDLPSTSACGAEVLTVTPASVSVSKIIFVGGNILINAGFNSPGTLFVTSAIANAGVLSHGVFASAAKKASCKAGKVLVKVGNKKKCVANSFGTTTKAIAAAGSYQIKLAPNAAAKKALSKGRTLKVKVTLTFKPAGGGKAVVKTKSITVKGKKKH